MAMIPQQQQQQQSSPQGRAIQQAEMQMQLSHQAYSSLPTKDQWTTHSEKTYCEHQNHHHAVDSCEHQSHHHQQWQQQQQHLLPQQQQQQTMMNMQQRSNPIAIIRPPAENVTNGKMSSRSIDDSSDDESDTGVVDVEKDAKRLQRKYGTKVVVASTFQQSSESTLSESILRAPYLGSLSRSENYLSLPPIRLSEPQNYDESAGPPTEIGGTAGSCRGAGYGSLRDSQEKGRFLDGPASYREPRTGQLLPLNPRARYKGVAASNTTATSTKANLSIGERIQIAQRQKEKKRLKDEENKNSNTSSGEGGQNNTNTATASSLSAMMDQAASKETEMEPISTTASTADINADGNDDRWPPSALGEGETSGIIASELNEFGEIDKTRRQHQQQQNPSEVGDVMMSTSLTAFEYLMSANKLYRTSAAAAAGKQRAAFYQPGMMIPEHLVREEQFQPLSRSMSDPTPQLRSPRFGPRTTNLPPSMQMMQQPLGETGETMMLTTRASVLANGYFGAAPGSNEQPSVSVAALYNTNTTTPRDHHDHLKGEEGSVMLPYGSYPAEQEHDNPDTDYAFDMDE